MKTILLFGACMFIAGLVATTSAQTTKTTDKEGNTTTTEPSDKYGDGGTHIVKRDKNDDLVEEIYKDKKGTVREKTIIGEKEEFFTPTSTFYFNANGAAVVQVVHRPTGDTYYLVSGKKIGTDEGKRAIKKAAENPPETTEKAPEKPEQPKPEINREALIPSAEVAPTAFNWSGFYVGIEGVYTRSSADFSLMPSGDWRDFPDLSDELRFRGRHEFDQDGGGIGGYGGYNWMLCSHIVFGLEVEGRSVWGLAGHFHTGDFDFNGNGMFDVHSSFDTEDIPYLITFGPRMGYNLDRFLPYVKGGLAFGQVDAHQGIRTSIFGGSTFGKESEAVQVGWCVGGGLEYKLTDHWRLRVEYQYTDLGTFDFMGSGRPDSFRGFTSWNSVHVTEHSGLFGLGYSFH
jgi:outer membrane immunogenic protein